MSTVVTVIHVIVCLFLMLVVLLQAGKGGGMGAAFGGGSNAGSVFGGSGAGNFLRRLTVGAATSFMLTSMLLAWLGSTTGADALKSFSQSQLDAAEQRQQSIQQVLDSAGDGDAPTPDAGAIMMETPDAGMDMLDADASAPAVDDTTEAPAPTDTAPSDAPAPTDTAPSTAPSDAPAPTPAPNDQPAGDNQPASGAE